MILKPDLLGRPQFLKGYGSTPDKCRGIAAAALAVTMQTACDAQLLCEHSKLRLAFFPLSEETAGGTSLPPTVTLTVKEATMGKVKLIVYECFTGKQNPQDVFTMAQRGYRGLTWENSRQLV